MSDELRRLTEICRGLLDGCRKTADDGTVLFTPDGVGNYDALWVRDLGYMAEYCGDLLGAPAIEACLEFILRGQREDGWFPDRVEASGEPVYAAGAKGAPVGLANLDNTTFFVQAVYSLLQMPEVESPGEKFARWAPAIDRGMDRIPLSREGLVWNDRVEIHSPYGFTDTVGKSGRLFYESLLYWRACRQLEELYGRYIPSSPKEREYARRAERVEGEIYRLYDRESGLFFAAELDCRQPDVWGAAYLLCIGFPVRPEIRKGLEDWLLHNQDRYLYRGQVSHLPDGGSWDRLLIDVAPGEYQNGAYWATASGWVWSVLKRLDPPAADKMMRELLEDFETGGVCECVNRGYRKLPEYVVSGVNVRGPVRDFERAARTDL